MIEMLLALLIFMVAVGVILQMAVTISTAKIKSHSINPMEWELFVTNMRTESKASVSTAVSDNQIHLIINDQTVMIEKYKSVLRRQVNGKGHEVLLQGVKTFEVIRKEAAVYLKVTDQSDQVYSARFYGIM